MLGMPPLCKRGTDSMYFGFVNFVRRPSVCAQPPGFDNNQPPGKVVRGKRCEMRGANIPITKFTEMEWNDGVFEGSKEHLDVLGSALFFIYFCEFWLFYTQRFFYLIYVFKGAKLAKFIRYEAMWKLMRDEIRDARCEMRDASISITKFTKLGWNDGVFEGSKEHLDGLGRALGFLLLWVLIFFTQRFFYSHYVFKGAKLAKFIRFEAVGKLMWWCDDAMEVTD